MVYMYIAKYDNDVFLIIFLHRRAFHLFRNGSKNINNLFHLLCSSNKVIHFLKSNSICIKFTVSMNNNDLHSCWNSVKGLFLSAFRRRVRVRKKPCTQRGICAHIGHRADPRTLFWTFSNCALRVFGRWRGSRSGVGFLALAQRPSSKSCSGPQSSFPLYLFPALFRQEKTLLLAAAVPSFILIKSVCGPRNGLVVVVVGALLIACCSAT